MAPLQLGQPLIIGASLQRAGRRRPGASRRKILPGVVKKRLRMWLVDELRKSNASTRALTDEYLGHRQQTTRLVLESSPRSSNVSAGSARRLCALGAGNCLDLDLPMLTSHFEEVHLVDVDREALELAVAQQSPEAQSRLFVHAPVDLSGLLDKLERWKRLEVTETELIEHHRQTACALHEQLGSFDMVLSGSFITQMQLSVLLALGDQHQLFDAARHILAVTHLHALYELTAPGGKALLVTDVTSNQSFPQLDTLPSDANMLDVLRQVIAAQCMFYIARPGFFHLLHQQDPLLSSKTTLSAPLAAWLWQNGPGQRFLVYAMALERRA